MQIIEMIDGSYGVEHDGKMIVENESMGVCDAIIYAYNYPVRKPNDLTEGREIAEEVQP